MISFTACSPDGGHFTLAVDGAERTYPNDKSGKRQAILDGLEAIEPLTVGDDVYLPGSTALEVVATVLYPDGIETDAAYRTVCQVTEKACAHLGYGAEADLAPPTVPFAARGTYRKRYLPLDPAVVREELDAAHAGPYEPELAVSRRQLCNRAAWAVYKRAWVRLTDAQQAQLRAQVDGLVAAAGWTVPEASGNTYTRPLPVDAGGAAAALARALSEAGGRPLPQRTVVTRAQRGAYGQTFYTDDLAPALAEVVARTLTAHGYEPEPERGEYRPVPLTLPADAAETVAAALAALAPVETTFGPGLLLEDVLAAVRPHTGDRPVGQWQAAQLLAGGTLPRLLRRRGYQTEITWCQPYQFRPVREARQALAVLLKEVRVTRDEPQKLSLAEGLAVHVPALALDDEADTLVYLQMLGPKQAVKANWAALVGGGKVHWIGRQRVQLNGMKEHVKVQTTLPCGWTDAILLHKQASLEAMSPDAPFYLLDDGTQPRPPLFYPMLNRALALPLLEAWSDYLWETGRAEGLIQLLDGGTGRTYAAWRVLPAGEPWQTIVTAGLQNGQIHFQSKAATGPIIRAVGNRVKAPEPHDS